MSKIEKNRENVERFGKTARWFRWLNCKLGLHWLGHHSSAFRDVVAGKMVYDAMCVVCKKEMMVDSKHPLGGHRIDYPPPDESRRALEAFLEDGRKQMKEKKNDQ